MSVVERTTFGFRWGPVTVTRIARLEGRGYIVAVNGIDIYVSKKGRSVRAFRGDKELT